MRARRTLPARVIEKFVADDGANLAIVIAWNALTSIFPIALAIAAIGGVALRLAGFDPVDVYGAVLLVFPQDEEARRQAFQAVEGVRDATGLLAVIALLGFLWTASGLFGAMEWVFSRIHRTRPRDFARQKLMAVAMMGIFTVFVVLAVGSSSLLPLLDDIPGVPISLTEGPAAAVIQAVVGLASGFVLFLAVYTVVPNQPSRPGRAWPGALLAGAGFELIALLFPLYIGVNRGINQYGKTFALIFVLLAFFYLLGVIAVLGAELNAVLHPAPEWGGKLSPAHLPEEARAQRAPRGVRRALFGALAAAIGLLAATRRRPPGG